MVDKEVVEGVVDSVVVCFYIVEFFGCYSEGECGKDGLGV